MSGNMGKLGAADLLRDKNDAQRRTGRARGLLKPLALGLMLACGTAYASEPPAPAPVPTTQNKVDQANAAQADLVSTNIGDDFTDGSIALLVFLIGLFLAINFLDSRKKDRSDS